MTDKLTIMKTFNTHFFEFLDDVITILPDNEEIKSARTSFETIKRANPTILIKVWHSHVYLAYKETLDKGDISYFINKDYDDDLKGLHKHESVLTMINNVREPLRNMSELNKEHSTKYIQNLCKLSTLYQ